jgi:hypothetical protein
MFLTFFSLHFAVGSYISECVNTWRVAIIVASLAIAFKPAAEAGPFRNFFRKVRHALAHPQKSTQTHKTAHTTVYGTAQKERSTNGTHTEHSAVNGPPNTGNTKIAKAHSSKGSHPVDLPYGTPVPGKQGFVTSPFAPNSGYVDVRGFPPGTQVKDPYSGKTFLTP